MSVFVISSFRQRPSIKDVECSSKKTLTFDSRNVSKTGKAFLPEFHETDPNKRKWLSCDEKPDMLNRAVVDEICQRMRKKTNLHLLGLDILVENGSGNYALRGKITEKMSEITKIRVFFFLHFLNQNLLENSFFEFKSS